jgi:putative membrane protein
MKNLKRGIGIAIIAISFYACGKKNPTKPEVNKDTLNQTENVKADEDFAKEAAEGGMYEVMLGELAVKKGSKEIKKLGQMMVDDHGAANADLKKIAQQKNIELPTQLGNEKQSIYDGLMNKEGKEFDKEYASQMVKDHEADIKKFEKEADGGDDSDFKNFASEKLPTLRHHLEMSKDAKKTCDKY